MSKLDNIQTTCDNCEYAPALSETCKERIKALFVELVSEVSHNHQNDTVWLALQQRIEDL